MAHFLTVSQIKLNLRGHYRAYKPSKIIYLYISAFLTITSISYFFSVWISKTHDFEDQELLNATMKFFESIVPNALIIQCTKDLEDIEHRPAVKERGRSTAPNQNLGSTLGRLSISISTKLNEHPLKFSESTPGEIADQLTLLEYQIMTKIRPTEFLKQAWSKQEKDEKAPNIVSYIDWFNKVSRWVSTEIVKGDTPEQRSVIIAKFIQIGMRLKELSNFNGVMEVISSLHSAAISRLKQSWAVLYFLVVCILIPKKLLPSNILENFSTLNQLMTPNENFKPYREAIKNSSGTCIPYLGLWLSDLTFIDDGNPDNLDSGLLNFEKVSMTAKRIREFQDCLTLPYNIGSYDKVRSLLANAEIWDENEIFRFSKLREARHDEDAQLPSRFDSKTFAKISRSLIGGKQNVSTEANKLTHRDWQLLLAIATIESHNKDSVIVKEGISNNYLYRIKQGKLRVEKKNVHLRAILSHINISPDYAGRRRKCSCRPNGTSTDFWRNVNSRTLWSCKVVDFEQGNTDSL